jgi:membrane-bound metal-dependent hydrolase YbcI (DUF457 family)
MTGKSHLIIGATAGIALAIALRVPAAEGLVMVALGALGGLLPDIDSPFAYSFSGYHTAH